jgi:DNA-binding XRE family transcriptional regulator
VALITHVGERLNARSRSVGAIRLTLSRAGVYFAGVSNPLRPRLKGPVHGRIRRLRVALGLSQARLAELVGVDKTAVSHWECRMGLPDESRWQPLADALGTTVDRLMKGEKSWALMCRLTETA